jgi:hypothetical protein
MGIDGIAKVLKGLLEANKQTVRVVKLAGNNQYAY